MPIRWGELAASIILAGVVGAGTAFLTIRSELLDIRGDVRDVKRDIREQEKGAKEHKALTDKHASAIGDLQKKRKLIYDTVEGTDSARRRLEVDEESVLIVVAVGRTTTERIATAYFGTVKINNVDCSRNYFPVPFSPSATTEANTSTACIVKLPKGTHEIYAEASGDHLGPKKTFLRFVLLPVSQ